MRPGARSAAQIFSESIDVKAEPRSAHEIIVEICIGEGWCADLSQAHELADASEALFLRYLRDQLNELRAWGRFARYAFNSSSDYFLQGAAFVEPCDPPNIRKDKQRVAYFEDYVNALGDLSPRDFEVLCTRVLELLGVENPTLTRFSGDEGVDFFGRLRLSGFLAPDLVTPNIETQLSVWIVGQAKHYKALKVSTFDVRDLVGAVELAKAKAFSSKSDKYPDLKIRACDPVFSLFMTTGKISSSTWALLNNSGVVGMDGQMVAAFLARHGVCTASGKFRKSDLSKWLKRFVPS